MIASDVMTARLVTIAKDASIIEAIRAMLQNRISGIPVVDGTGRAVGIVTEGDLLRRVETGTERRRPKWLEFLLGPGRLAEAYVGTHGRKVAEIMTTDPITVAENAPLEEVVRLMERHRIKRVLVAREGILVGIISRANLLHALARVVAEVRPTIASDAEIRERILAEMKAQPWAPGESVNVIVRDGIVDLRGVILDDRERSGLRVLAENIAGVKDVRDHLVWIDPTSGFAIGAEDAAAFAVDAQAGGRVA